MATDDGTRTISGRVTRTDGHPLAGLAVVAFACGLRTETELGAVLTDGRGRFLIAYSWENAPNVQACVFDQTGTEIARSEILFRAAPQDVIDIVIEEPEQAPAAFDRVYADVVGEAARAGLPVESLTDPADVAYVANATGHHPDEVRRLVEALRLGAELGDGDLVPLAYAAGDDVRASVESAAAAGIIPAERLAALPRLLDALRARRFRLTFFELSGGNAGLLAKLIETGGPAVIAPSALVAWEPEDWLDLVGGFQPYAAALSEAIERRYPDEKLLHVLALEGSTDAARYRRLYRLLPEPVETATAQGPRLPVSRYAVVSRLLHDGLDSAVAIAALPLPAFIQRYEDEVGRELLEFAHRRAMRVTSASIQVAVGLHRVARPELSRVLPASGAANVECARCRPADGPTAFLLDGLRFLDDSGALPALVARRADLLDVTLDCAGADQRVPELDLVNELLERLVAPESVGFEPAWEQVYGYLDRIGVPVGELFDAFAPLVTPSRAMADPFEARDATAGTYLGLSPAQYRAGEPALGWSPSDVDLVVAAVGTDSVATLSIVERLRRRTGLELAELAGWFGGPDPEVVEAAVDDVRLAAWLGIGSAQLDRLRADERLDSNDLATVSRWASLARWSRLGVDGLLDAADVFGFTPFSGTDRVIAPLRFVEALDRLADAGITPSEAAYVFTGSSTHTVDPADLDPAVAEVWSDAPDPDKLALLVDRLNLPVPATLWLLRNGTLIGGPDLRHPPATAPDPAVGWEQVTAVLDFARAYRALGSSLLELIDLAGNPGASHADWIRLAARRQGWEAADVHAVTAESPFPTVFSRPAFYLRLLNQLRLAGRCGVAPGTLLDWFNALASSPAGTWSGARLDIVAAQVRAGARAVVGHAGWPRLCRDVDDRLRERRRDALVAALPESDLAAYLLVDPQVPATVLTTRVEFAIDAVQTFGQRVLMGLEPGVVLDDERARQWNTWRRRYSMWQANRNTFLYPENWLTPDDCERSLQLPLAEAVRLRRERRYAEALRRLHTIFDPTGKPRWKFRPFAEATPETLAGLVDNPPVLDEPVDPVAVARGRLGAFMTHVVMTYLDTLIAWGDEDGAESVQLYRLARQILGERPTRQALSDAEHPAPLTYRTLTELAPGQAPPLSSLGRLAADVSSFVQPTDNDGELATMMYCTVPPNERLLAYWDEVEARCR